MSAAAESSHGCGNGSAASAMTEEIVCAICFDEIAERTVLPCACKIDYCLRCWDRSLAQSFNSAGQARCPTCRMPVRVDFDAESMRLVFSKETQASMQSLQELVNANVAQAHGDMAADEARHLALEQARRGMAEMRDEVVTRLAEQAIPAQVRLLQRFGAANASLQQLAKVEVSNAEGVSVSELKRHLVALGKNADDCVERAELVNQLRETSDSWPSVAASHAASAGGATGVPHCVCGDALKRLTGLERARRFIEHCFPGLPRDDPRFQHVLRQHTLGGSSGIVCDVCDGKVGVDSAVWTCEAGDATILHAMSYDVCDLCFIKHALQDSSALEETEVAGPSHAIL